MPDQHHIITIDGSELAGLLSQIRNSGEITSLRVSTTGLHAKVSINGGIWSPEFGRAANTPKPVCSECGEKEADHASASLACPMYADLNPDARVGFNPDCSYVPLVRS
jgi:hypothetical protein